MNDFGDSNREHIDARRCAGAMLTIKDKHTAHYPLPDDLYDSKDWRAGSYAERVEWLHSAYESKKEELDQLYDQLAKNSSSRQQTAQPAGDEQDRKDAERIEFIERQAKASRTGVSITYEKHAEDGYVIEKGFRFMSFHYATDFMPSARDAIDAARERERK